MKKGYLLFVLLYCFMAGGTFAQNCGTTNIAATKDASASSHKDTYSDAPNVVDGADGTNWKSSATGVQWLMIHLGQTYSICNINIKWASSFYYASAFKVYVSNSASTGTGSIVYETSASSVSQNDIALSTPVSGSYIRIEMTAAAATWADHYEMIEVKVYAGAGNIPPTTSITSPPANATFSYGSNIVINADADDADGTVSKVEFYEGNNKLGEDSNAPYSYTWVNAAAGTHLLSTKAIDNNNTSGTSGQVSITVSNAPASAGWSLTGNTAVDSVSNFIGTKNAAALVIKTADHERLRILSNGKVLINATTSPDPEADLAVNGNIYAKKLRITQTNWADYVFDSSYRLPPLQEVEAFIGKNRHLPDVPSAKEVETNGLNVGDQHAVLLRKVEELTLYIIRQQKEIVELKSKIENSKKSIHK